MSPPSGQGLPDPCTPRRRFGEVLPKEHSPGAPRAAYPRYMTTPLPVAKALFVFMAALFVMALVERNPFLLFYAVLALAMSGYLVGAAVENKRPSARR